MPSVLQTCPYIFLHIPKPKLSNGHVLQIQKFLQHMSKNKNTPLRFLINEGKICKPY